jgi:selenide,water dikinase
MTEQAPVRLTSYCQAAGCAAKFAPADLEATLAGLAPGDGDGFASSLQSRDDAGWIDLGDRVLLQSVDFFTPVVDDPHRFGQIAAANALSDIYAMGGEPLTAMNLVCFPRELDLGILREILAGGGAKIAESGARLCGGHSVRDSEPKYGVSVSGEVERGELVRNRGARAGDVLVLTKPLGVGIITTALKRQLIGEAEVEEALDAMCELNAPARDAMREAGASAATDVTGYGLLGHLWEMVAPDGLGARVRRDAVPVWEPAVGLAVEGCFPGGLEANRSYLEGRVRADGPSGEDLLALYDPQTSGGLLIAIDPRRAESLVRSLRARAVEAATIGEVTAGPELVVTA